LARRQVGARENEARPLPAVAIALLLARRRLEPAKKILSRAFPPMTKKAEYRHSERRFCAKNLSWSFVLNSQACLALNDHQGFFSQLVLPWK
jgi:hypothetical protein